jgi:hypothetical protein
VEIIKPGVFGEIVVVVVMQGVEFFDFAVAIRGEGIFGVKNVSFSIPCAEPEKEEVVVFGGGGVVEMGGNEGWVLDYGFPCFANGGGDNDGFDW